MRLKEAIDSIRDDAVEFKKDHPWLAESIPFAGMVEVLNPEATYHILGGESAPEGYVMACEITPTGDCSYVCLNKNTDPSGKGYVPVSVTDFFDCPQGHVTARVDCGKRTLVSGMYAPISGASTISTTTTTAEDDDTPDFLKVDGSLDTGTSKKYTLGSISSVTTSDGTTTSSEPFMYPWMTYPSVSPLSFDPAALHLDPVDLHLKDVKDPGLLPHITRAVEEGLRKKIEMDTIIIDKGVAVSQGADHVDMIMGLKVKYAEEGKLPCGSAFVIMKDTKPKAEDKKEGDDDKTDFVRIRTATGEHLIRKADIKTVSVVREPGTIDLGGFKTAGPLKKIAHIFTTSDRRPITTFDMESIDDVFKVLAHRHLSVDPEAPGAPAAAYTDEELESSAAIDPDAGFDAFARSIKARDAMLKAKKTTEEKTDPIKMSEENPHMLITWADSTRINYYLQGKKLDVNILARVNCILNSRNCTIEDPKVIKGGVTSKSVEPVVPSGDCFIFHREEKLYSEEDKMIGYDTVVPVWQISGFRVGYASTMTTVEVKRYIGAYVIEEEYTLPQEEWEKFQPIYKEYTEKITF